MHGRGAEATNHHFPLLAQGKDWNEANTEPGIGVVKLGWAVDGAARTEVQTLIKFCFGMDRVVENFEIRVSSKNDNRHVEKGRKEEEKGRCPGDERSVNLNTKSCDHVGKPMTIWTITKLSQVRTFSLLS